MKIMTFPESIILRKMPINFIETDLHLFASDLKYFNKERYMLSLKNIDVLKDVLFDKQRLKFYDKYCFVHKKPLVNLLARLSFYFHRKQKITAGLWVIDDWSKEYFHWLTDVLTRILLTEEFSKDHLIVLPNKFKRFKYISESLEILGKKFIFAESKHLYYKNLLVAPHSAITGNFDIEKINQLRDRFIDSDHVPSRLIYISRQNANKRKVTNEAEVIAALSKFDFEIHIFEDYSLSQQIAIMQETKVLLSLHGAGLTNMLFMPKNSKIFELRNGDESKLNCFFSMASALEHEYYYLTNKGSSTDTHIADITVDIDNLISELNKITVTT